jgi:parvulin-like peptidyl-prolyl isomerase
MQSQNSLPEQPNDYELTETEKLEILTLLIKIQLASEEAIRLGFEPTPEEVESIYQGVINEYGGAKNLQLELNATGDTPEAFKDQITRNEALKYWRSLFFLKDARVTEAEAREFYEANITTAQHGEEVRALEILIPLPMDSEPNSQARQNARKLAQRILTEARADRDFEELIQIYMSPPALAATNNGQMGWVARDTTSLPALEEVLFSLAPGEVGEIVESPFNLHIVKVMEKRPAGVLSFAESRPEIISFLTENKIQNLLQDYLNKLVQMAEIQILDPEFKPLWEEAHLTAPDLPNPPAPEN